MQMQQILLLLLIIIATGALFLYTKITQNSGYSQSSGLPSCGSNYTLFTVPLFNQSSVLSVLPLADFIPPDHVFPTPHAYIYTDNPNAAGSKSVSKDGAYLYAPTNMVLTQIAIRNLRHTFGVYENVTDYTLVFQPCKEFDLYFHNVASLLYQPFINASLQILKQCSQDFCQANVYIPISVGQVIGTIGNSSKKIQGLDVGARDYRLSTGRNFIDANHLCPIYGGQPNIYDRCYAVCPYSYFTNSIQQQFHFFYANGTTISSCGTIYQDINGTAQGYWFPASGATNSISPEATDIFLGNDTASTTTQVFSAGVAVPNLPAGLYKFKPNPSNLVNRTFGGVTPSQVYCYQTSLSYLFGGPAGSTATIAIQLVNSSTLRIQRLNGTCGSGPWSLGPGATQFVR